MSYFQGLYRKFLAIKIEEDMENSILPKTELKRVFLQNGSPANEEDVDLENLTSSSV